MVSQIHKYIVRLNPIALRRAKTPEFGSSECNRV